MCSQSIVIHDSDLVDSEDMTWHQKIDALLAAKPCQLALINPLEQASVKRYVRQVAVLMHSPHLLKLPHTNPQYLAERFGMAMDTSE